MEKKQEKTVVCECGDTHILPPTQIVVSDDAFNALLKTISETEFKHILVFYGLSNDELSEKFKQCECVKDKELSFVILPNLIATTALADQIEDKGQDVVVAIGGEEVISMAKYYAYSFSNPVFIFPVGQFLDFTFSKFARLYDGVTFDFYASQSPEGIFVDTSLNKYNQYQSYYLSSKYISVFDNQMSGLVFGNQFCQRMVDFYNDALEKYACKFSKSLWESNINNIWTMIRIGQAMTFFNQSKFFFGGDRAVVEMLNALKPSASFLELETVALKLILNSYDCFLQDANCNAGFNLNKQINFLCKTLKVSVSQIMKKLASNLIISPTKEIVNSFGSYQPYLFGCFKNLAGQIFKIHSNLALKDNVLKKYEFNAMCIENAFALSPYLFDKPTLLHLIGNFGYLDKLLD